MIIEHRALLRKAIEEFVQEKGEPLVPWAPHPTDDQVKNAKILSSRYKGLDMMPKNGVCIEVGTQTGLFAREILDRCQPKEFHVVDVDYSMFRYELFEKEIADGTLTIHEGKSAKIMESFPEYYFDLIYIDADHAYAGVVNDIKASAPSLKPNGYMIFNDYTVWSPQEVSPYGILQAVNEFLAREAWEVVFLALHGQGYHDICLKRM